MACMSTPCSSPSAARAPARRLCSTAAAVQGTCTRPRCRSSPLFAQRPRSTWVSLQTARQVVKTNVEELRARPVHMASLVSCGCALRRQARPARVWCARAHTQAPVHRDACGRFTRNLRSCPPVILYPLCVLCKPVHVHWLARDTHRGGLHETHTPGICTRHTPGIFRFFLPAALV
jgi:hypothetical protein